MEYDTKCETVTDCTGGAQQDDTNGGGYNGGGTNGGGTSGGALDFYGVPAPPQVGFAWSYKLSGWGLQCSALSQTWDTLYGPDCCNHMAVK